jgi:hypothetical protein
MTPAVTAEVIRKRHPGSCALALDGFDLSVPTGTVHGLLGPNGADAATLARRYLAHLRHRPAELAGAVGFPILADPRVPDRVPVHRRGVEALAATVTELGSATPAGLVTPGLPSTRC